MLGYVLPAVLYLSTYKKEVKQAWTDISHYCTWTSTDRSHDNHHDENENENENIRHGVKNILNSNISNESDDNNNSNIDNNDCVITFNNEYAQQTDQSVFYATSSKNFFQKHKIVEKKTLSQLFKSIFPFLLPIFMIIFGILSMVIGVSSIFLF